MLPDPIFFEMESETPSTSHVDNQLSSNDILENTGFDFNFVTVTLVILQPWIIYPFVLLMLQP